MIPVDQTKYGKPEGNCWMACIASLLELDISDTPDLSEQFEDGPTWWEISQAFAMDHGYLLIHLPFEAKENNVLTLKPPLAPAGWSILCGKADRGKDGLIEHCVVACDGEITHDPNDKFRNGLTEVDSWVILVPIVEVKQ